MPAIGMPAQGKLRNSGDYDPWETVEQVIFSAEQADEYYFKEGCYILEMLNSSQDEALSVVRATVKAGVITRWHALDNTVERYVIVSGQGTVEVGDNPPAQVRPGDVVLIPAGVRQRIRNSADVDLVFLALCTPRFKTDNYRDLQEK